MKVLVHNPYAVSALLTVKRIIVGICVYNHAISKITLKYKFLVP